MRVLFITHSFPRYPGDIAGVFLLRLARALAENGTEVRVLAPAAPGLTTHTAVDGTPVRFFRYGPRSWETLAYTGTMAEQVSGSIRGKAAFLCLLLGGRRAVKESVRSFAPDVVHAHWWLPSGISAASAHDGVPLVTTLHGSDVRLARRHAWARGLLRRVVRESAAVTAVSRWLADEAMTIAPLLKAQVEPMPVDTEHFGPAGARRTHRFLFVGRLNQQKGAAVLLDALAATTAGAQLDLVGDGPERTALTQRAAALGVSHRVVFHGALAQASLLPLYRTASAVVIPSEGEGLGLVAAEAQLCETPVIAFRSGGLPELVHDGETGVLTPLGDVLALARAMDEMLASPDRARALGVAGRRSALERFSPAVVAERYQRVYDQVVRAR